jgi:hypothetical protein
MARVPIVVEVKDAAGNGVASASVTVKARSTGVNSVLYNAEVAGSIISNPTIADALGRVTVWADTDNFNLTISGTGITTYTVAYNGDIADGSVTTIKLADDAATADKISDAPKVGLTDSGAVRRGKFVQAATGTRTNTAYGALSNGPDVVTNVVLPTDGLIVVGYQATWQQSAGAARAAIFVGANQLKSDAGGTAPAVQEAVPSAGTGVDYTLGTGATGLLSGSFGGWTGDVTTGQVIGTTSGFGVTYIFAAAGTYDVSIQFKAPSGTVTVKNRKLWVWTVGF